MSVRKTHAGFGAGRPGRMLLALALLVGLAGCGQTSPIPALRGIGAEVKIDRTANRKITAIRFPAGATNEDLAPLANIDDTRRLATVDLSGTDITDEGLKYLENLKALRTLNLSQTPVTDEGLKILADLKLPSLQELMISDTRVTGEGLLEHIPSLERLTFLDVSRPLRPEQPPERTILSALDFGIDLAGGTNLIYQVDREAMRRKIEEEFREGGDTTQGVAPGEIESRISGSVMEQMVGAVARRLNPSGVEEITVRQVGADRIEVIIPKASREVIERKKDQMTRLGSLEFAVLATRENPEHVRIFEQISEAGTDDLYRPEDEDNGSLLASWRDWAVSKEGRSKQTTFPPEDGVITRTTADGSDQVLVVFEEDNRRVTGEYLRRAFPQTDESGLLAVGFMFNNHGGSLFSQLTGKYQPVGEFKYHLAILLDEKVESAPTINSIISDQGQISGRFSREEVDELVNVLNAGALAVPINPTPISEQTISASLGEDVRRQGLMAIAIAGVAVLVFMLLYYRFAGFVADLCLVLNILLVMGTMALIDATFTLPGLAGIVLTIGMAVDTNVLIFERMREERARGSSPRMAIHNGFDKAFSAILDSNVTTLITAVVLYLIGTDQIRGFAVTLFIGIVMSMFTALYFGRLIFDLSERKRWIKEPVSKSFFKGTNWDFIGKRRIAYVASALFIIAGMTALFVRGRENLDIDFSGGTMLTFQLEQERDFVEVRDALQDSLNDDTITVERLSSLTDEGSEPTEGSSAKGTLFRIRTQLATPDQAVASTGSGGSEDSAPVSVEDRVRQAIQDAGFQMHTVQMTKGEVQVIREPGEDTPEDADQTKFKEYRVRLEFDEGVSVTRIERGVANALGGLTRDGGNGEGGASVPIYAEPEEHFRLTDLEPAATGEDEEAEELQYIAATLVVTPDVTREHLDQTLLAMQENLAEGEFEQVNSFSSAVGDELKQTALLAMLVSMAAIIAYLWFRFQRVSFGLAAIVAVFHDLLFVLGAVALASYAVSELGITVLQLEDFKINLPMIAAFMTIIGYSLNDTIVIFDRIREIRGKNPKLTADMINLSLNQTLSRTLLTTFTTLLVVFILYWFGGEGIHGFAYCLVVGMVIGAYSTIYLAAPALLWLMNREAKKRTAGKPTTPVASS